MERHFKEQTSMMGRVSFGLLHIWLCLLAALSAVSCTEEEAVSGDPVPVRCTIGVRGIGDADATVPAELISSYRIVFVEQGTGLVCEVVEGRCTPAVARDEFEFQLGPGTYTVYAFGNMDEYFTGLGIAEGSPMPDLSEAVYDMGEGPAGPIPMSGTQEVTVTGRANQSFAVELVRMAAGIRFSFTNETSGPVDVEAVTLSPLTQGNIYLLPKNADTGQPLLPAPTTTMKLTHEVTPALTLAANAASVPGPAFYFNESVAAGAHATGRFVLSFKLRRGGTTEEVRYALAHELSYVRRNDFIVMPVRITDYIFSADVSFYPPIGGYPAAEISRKSNEEFFCTFRSPGDFAIMPRLRRYDDADGWLDMLNTAQVESLSIGTSGDTVIFETAPHLTDAGEILGKLGTASGTACVTLTVKLAPAAGISRELTCRIYIIKE